MKSIRFVLAVALGVSACGPLPLRAESLMTEAPVRRYCFSEATDWGELFPEDFHRYTAACRSSLLRGDSYLDWLDAQRSVYNDLIVRQDLAANDENVAQRIGLRLAQLDIVDVQDPNLCFRLVMGGGRLAFDPSDYLPPNVIAQERTVLRQLLEQSRKEPAVFVISDADRRTAQAIYDRQVAMLPQVSRDQLAQMLTGREAPIPHVGASAACFVARSTLSELSTMDLPEQARAFKALLLTGRGWMVAQTRSDDIWAYDKLKPAGVPPSAPPAVSQQWQDAI